MKLKENTLTRQNVMRVKKEIISSLKAGDAVLDLSTLETVDSTAVSLLLGFTREAQKAGLQPKLIDVPAKIKALIKLYGVGELLES